MSFGGQLDKLGEYKTMLSQVGIGEEHIVDAAQKLAQATADKQIQAKETLQAELVDTADKPVVIAKKQQNIKKPSVRKTLKAAVAGAIKAITGTVNKEAKEFKQSHPELSGRGLDDLYDQIVKDKSASPEEILKKLAIAFPKKSQASDALAFLLTTLPASDPLRGKILQIKAQFDADNKAEIEKGQASTLVARDLALKGHGKAKHIDAFLTDIVASEAEIVNVCAMLSKDYSEAELESLLHSVLKSANSILHDGKLENAHLRALCSEVQSIQAGIGIFTTFKKAMPTIESSFRLADLEKPAHITEKLLFKSFLALVSERVYSSSKVLAAADQMVNAPGVPVR